MTNIQHAIHHCFEPTTAAFYHYFCLIICVSKTKPLPLLKALSIAFDTAARQPWSPSWKWNALQTKTAIESELLIQVMQDKVNDCKWIKCSTVMIQDIWLCWSRHFEVRECNGKHNTQYCRRTMYDCDLDGWYQKSRLLAWNIQWLP